jgi:hypothetical protein
MQASMVAPSFIAAAKVVATTLKIRLLSGGTVTATVVGAALMTLMTEAIEVTAPLEVKVAAVEGIAFNYLACSVTLTV